MMTGNEMEDLYRQINYCATSCKGEPIKCSDCKGRISNSIWLRLVKSYGEIISALKIFQEAIVYDERVDNLRIP